MGSWHEEYSAYRRSVSGFHITFCKLVCQFTTLHNAARWTSTTYIYKEVGVTGVGIDIRKWMFENHLLKLVEITANMWSTQGSSSWTVEMDYVLAFCRKDKSIFKNFWFRLTGCNEQPEAQQLFWYFMRHESPLHGLWIKFRELLCIQRTTRRSYHLKLARPIVRPRLSS